MQREKAMRGSGKEILTGFEIKNSDTLPKEKAQLIPGKEITHLIFKSSFAGILELVSVKT